MEILGGMHLAAGRRDPLELPWGAVPLGGPSPVEGPVGFLLAPSSLDAEALHAAAATFLSECLEVVETCECSRGCGSCTGGDPQSASESPAARTVPDRHHVAALLRELLGADDSHDLDDGQGSVSVHPVERIRHPGTRFPEP